VQSDLVIFKSIVSFLNIIPSLQWMGLSAWYFAQRQAYLHHQSVSFVCSYLEFQRLMLEQLDMRVEAHNISLFANHFKESKNIRLPRVLPQFTTEHVLVETFEEGRLLSEVCSHASFLITNRIDPHVPCLSR
jgi:predicted unusual protein kinase regulating ubiquinone biosynthesis (AarF/ABC1/UbiB family)